MYDQTYTTLTAPSPKIRYSSKHAKTKMASSVLQSGCECCARQDDEDEAKGATAYWGSVMDEGTGFSSANRISLRGLSPSLPCLPPKSNKTYQGVFRKER